MKLDKHFKNKKSKAQSLIEYALILAMVTVIAITALQLLGQNMSSTLKKSADTINTGTDAVQKAACEAMGGTWKAGTSGDAGSCELPESTSDSK